METTKLVETSTNPIRLKGLSLQQRLPLLICVLLLMIMVTFTLISYQGVKNAALTSGRERLLSLSSQLSTRFSQSMQNLLTATRTVGNQSSVKRFLKSKGEEQKDSALMMLKKIQEDSTSVLVDLLNTNYQTVLRSEKDSIAKKVNFDSLQSILAIHRDTAIGKIYVIRDSMYYPVIAAITDNKQKIGYIVRWRRLSATQQTIEQLSQLLGTSAALYIGNADGSLWTDMIKPVPHYVLDTAQLNKPVEHTTAAGKRFITAAKTVTNTPWLVSVEFPRQLILESANRLLKWMIFAGIVLLVIGILIAWIMSRNIIQPLNQLTAAASGIAAGNYSPTAGVERRDEVGKLARAFNAMIGQVSEARAGLEQKIVESGQMNEQLRQLTAHLQNIREEERIHIAREMHDELGQLLTAFKMDISWLDKRMGDTDNIAIKEKLADMNKLIDDSVIFVRKLASELRPSMLDDFGLIPALEWHSEEFNKRFDIKVDFHSDTRELKTSPVIATGLFRMYQESLTNVARHAEATKVSATLLTTKDRVCLSVQDDGKGFSLINGDPGKTLGLLGMRERAAMIGGKLEINSAPGKGTYVVVTVPLNNGN
ncbi:MAG: HAMP domain-containing protein [Chitinophagaceae bacterium]